MQLTDVQRRVLTEIGVIRPGDKAPSAERQESAHKLMVRRRREVVERMLAPDPEPPAVQSPRPVDVAAEVCPGRMVEPGRIVAAVAERYGVPAALLSTGSRRKDVSQARAAACLALRNRGMSFPAIGRVLGRTHSTVMSAVRRASVA